MERQLLGRLLVNNGILHEHRLDDFLRPHHFFDAAHGEIYRLILAQIEGGEMATPLTIARDITERGGRVAEIVHPKYLGALADDAVVDGFEPGLAASVIHDLWFRRLSETSFRDNIALLYRLVLALHKWCGELQERVDEIDQRSDRSVDVAAFRKHLNQGYAMLKSIERGELPPDALADFTLGRQRRRRRRRAEA